MEESTPLLPNNRHNNNYNINNKLNSSFNLINNLNYNNQFNIYNFNNYEIQDTLPINNYIIKYDWLTSEQVTKDIIDKYGKDFICPICYEKLLIKENIHITKCNHIFHYYCIERAIDNNILDCPICRCNIRTGEKKQANDLRINDNNYIENNNIYIRGNNNENNHNIYFFDNNNQEDINYQTNYQLLKNICFSCFNIILLLFIACNKFFIKKIIKGFIEKLNCIIKNFFKIVHLFIKLVFIFIILSFILAMISTLIKNKK